MEDCVNFHSHQYWPTLLDCYYIVSLLLFICWYFFFFKDIIKCNYQVIFRA